MNQKPNDGGPAFPVTSDNYADKWCSDGMTLRDYFAAKAMPLALADYRLQAKSPSNEPLPSWDHRHCLSVVASKAYEFADAMIEARK